MTSINPKRAPKLRSKKGNYYAEFYDGMRRPKTKTISLRTKNKTNANIRLAEFTTAYLYHGFDPWKHQAPLASTQRTLEMAVAAFLKAKSNRAAKTISSYAETLRLFVEEMGGGHVLLASVRAEQLAEFLESGEWASATVKSHYTRLRAFFNWCMAKGLIEDSPIADVPSPRTEQSAAAYLKRDEYHRLIEEAARTSSLLHDAIVLAVHTGLRRGELINLRWDDVDLERRVLHVRSHGAFKTKTKQNRTVPIVEVAHAVMAARMERDDKHGTYVLWGAQGKQVYGHYLSKLFRDCRKAAKLPEGIHFHSLRHTCASWMVLEGANLAVVQKLLGHSDIAVTMAYSHLEQDVLKREMDRTLSGYAGDVSASGDVRERSYAYDVSWPHRSQAPAPLNSSRERQALWWHVSVAES